MIYTTDEGNIKEGQELIEQVKAVEYERNAITEDRTCKLEVMKRIAVAKEPFNRKRISLYECLCIALNAILMGYIRNVGTTRHGLSEICKSLR